VWKSSKATGTYHVEWESSDEVLRKSPTTLEYELNENMNQFSLKACGMNCAHRYPSLKGKAIRDQPIRYVEWFKLFLEPAYLKTAIEKRIPWAPTSQDEIFQWFVNYLKFIHQEIRLKIHCKQTLDKAYLPAFTSVSLIHSSGRPKLEFASTNPSKSQDLRMASITRSQSTSQKQRLLRYTLFRKIRVFSMEILFSSWMSVEVLPM